MTRNNFVFLVDNPIKQPALIDVRRGSSTVNVFFIVPLQGMRPGERRTLLVDRLAADVIWKHGRWEASLDKNHAESRRGCC